MRESAEQRALIHWWHMAHRGLGVPDPRLLFHIPNGAYLGGGKLGAMRGGRLRAEGMVKGVPDLFLAVPREVVADDRRFRASGLFIEMKRTKGGRESGDQAEVRRLLKDQGYIVTVCRGWVEASEFIGHYLGAKKP